MSPESLAAAIAVARQRGLPVPSELMQQVAEQEAGKRGLLNRTFRDFISAANPTLLNYTHIPKLVDVGQRIIDGALDRVLVMLPPRYLKTEVFSKLLTAYYLLHHRKRHVAVTSYVARLTWEISAASRTAFRLGGGKISEETSAKDRWVTSDGGEMWAIGMGGGILGHGYHLGIVDDPIDPKKARSPHFRQLFEDWWPNTWLSRQERGHGQILVVMQRLGPEDPIDFLLRREVGERTLAAPEKWHVVVMDEIKSDEPLGRWNGPRGLPPTCTLEPDERQKGEVLSPTWIPEAIVKQAQAGAGPLTTASQRQQRPMAAEGVFWKIEWFTEYQQLPAHAYNRGKDWDTAYGEGQADSAWVDSARGTATREAPDEFTIYVEDCGWGDWDAPALVKKMHELPGPHHIEAKASGKSAAQWLKTYGIRAVEVTVAGDKLARATAAQPAVMQGRILVSARASQKLLWGEGQGLLRVTAEGLLEGARGLDLNDAFVQAIHRHLGLSEKKRTVQFR